MAARISGNSSQFRGSKESWAKTRQVFTSKTLAIMYDLHATVEERFTNAKDILNDCYYQEQNKTKPPPQTPKKKHSIFNNQFCMNLVHQSNN